MAAEGGKKINGSEVLKNMIVEEFSNIFAFEFNNSDMHDRVLCFQIIEDEVFETKVDSKHGQSHSEIGMLGEKDDKDILVNMVNNSAAREMPESKENEDQEIEPNNMTAKQQKLYCPVNKHQESKTSQMVDDKNKSIVCKLFVHSQWLAVQSPYFKALFYSGMKETYSKEVVMKIYKHELQAHLTLIEAMYKLDILNVQDYHLIVQVLILANKYDVCLVMKKCKYVLMTTTPSLEMCEYILREISHLPDMAGIYDMLETFLVKEFTPFYKMWTLKKFTRLSEAALRLLLRSDSLGTHSENTVFVALMKWVTLNILVKEHSGCDLLDLVRFEFLSADFLYDVVKDHIVARRMPGFNKYLLKGLAYHGFSQIRRDQLKVKPKKRPSLEDYGPTFSWVIGDKLGEKLRKSPGVPVFSKRFWCQGYPFKLQLGYTKDLSKCRFYIMILDLASESGLYVSYTAKSNLFAQKIQAEKHLFTAGQPTWGYATLSCNKEQMEKYYTINVWVEIV